MSLRALLDTMFYGNSLLAWLIAAAVLLVVLVVLLFARHIITKRVAKVAARTATRVDDFLVDVLEHTHALFLLVLALSAATLVLVLPAGGPGYVKIVLGAASIIQMLIWGNEGIAFWLRRQAADSPGALGTMTAMAFMARLVLWAVMFLLLLDNFGLQVTTLIAALGVTGIAAALAAQSVLGDLFAAISIYLDKPFEVGDSIAFDGFSGSIRSVGLRSTRINSLGGEELVVSNSDLLRSRIRNYKRMRERRIAFQIGVVYGLSRELVGEIPGLIRSAIEEQEQVRFDRSHFKGYGDSSLDFETVYYVLSPDYTVYMDVQQAINLGILRRFEERGIDFAFPTRTVIVERGVVAGDSSLEPAAGGTDTQEGTTSVARS
ncbi:MAG TPA: mechanosensitive ion channel family protein [Gemmatimonadaceae bacterium]